LTIKNLLLYNCRTLVWYVHLHNQIRKTPTSGEYIVL